MTLRAYITDRAAEVSFRISRVANTLSRRLCDASPLYDRVTVEVGRIVTALAVLQMVAAARLRTARMRRS